MKTLVLSSAVIVLFATNGWASAINNSHSNIKNLLNKTTVTTASTNLSGPSDTQTVLTTPATGEFLLTQFCGSLVTGGIRLDVTGLGGIAQTGVSGSCVSFSPGVIVPASTAITCATSAGASPGTTYFCSISGAQSAK